jgi:thiol-disulfide isomerase/thioredoxin
VVAVVASRSGSDDGVPAGVQQVRPVSVSGPALPVLGDGADPAVGVAIPEVDGKDFAGDPVAIRSDGIPKLIVFLAHWCPHCRNEVPVIAGWLADKGTPEGIDLLSVSTAASKDRPNYPPSVWLEREDWTPPALVDDADGTVAQAFGLSAFPFFVAVDAGGDVVARGSGELDVEALERLVDRARNR